MRVGPLLDWMCSNLGCRQRERSRGSPARRGASASAFSMAEKVQGQDQGQDIVQSICTRPTVRRPLSDVVVHPFAERLVGADATIPGMAPIPTTTWPRTTRRQRLRSPALSGAGIQFAPPASGRLLQLAVPPLHQFYQLGGVREAQEEDCDSGHPHDLCCGERHHSQECAQPEEHCLWQPLGAAFQARYSCAP